MSLSSSSAGTRWSDARRAGGYAGSAEAPVGPPTISNTDKYLAKLDCPICKRTLRSRECDVTIPRQVTSESSDADMPTRVHDNEQTDRLAVTKCGHVFCQECIRSAFKSTKSCPLCKQTLGKRFDKSVFPLFL
eukprot:GHVU01194164.1.p3 GENE.GHVU01194164.1~~GHVU01194164.1.p3  ORF type:complete len:133 (-),score=3.20 GHVU01194164.1:2778-3176(-)